MKKIIPLILYLSISFVNVINAQMNWVKEWDHRYGGIDGDYVVRFEKTAHQGFILAGKTASDSTGNKTTHIFGNGAFDYWIIRLDSGGNLLWEKDFQASGNDQLWALDVTRDGGFIIGGTSDSPIGGDKSQSARGGTDYWILKLDSMGNKVWDKTFGGADDEEIWSVIQTADGGYLIGGDSRSGISGDKTEAKFGINDYWVVKTDSLGVKLWDKVYGGPGYEKYRSSVQTPDHGFIHAGQSSSGVGGNKTDVSMGGVDYWLVKTDSMGTIQWDSAYGGNGDDNLQAIIPTFGGGYLIGGWSTSGVSGDKTQPSNGQYDFWILKIYANGTIQWDKDFGGTGIEDEFTDIYQTNDHGFLLGATSYSNAGGDKTDNNLGVEQPWIIKIDSSGNKLWDKTIFTNGHNEIGLAIETYDRDCYVIVSGDNGLAGGDKSEDAWGGFSSDYWIVKYCKAETSGIDELTKDNVLVYPNPASNQITITSGGFAIDRIIAKNVYGNIVYEQDILSDNYTINSESFPSGIYFIQSASKGNVFFSKVLVEH